MGSKACSCFRGEFVLDALPSEWYISWFVSCCLMSIVECSFHALKFCYMFRIHVFSIPEYSTVLVGLATNSLVFCIILTEAKMLCTAFLLMFWCDANGYLYSSLTGAWVEEASEEAQCPLTLDARQAWWSFCKWRVLLACDLIDISDVCFLLSDMCIFFASGPQAIIWSSQVQGVPSSDPHPQEQTEVCSYLPWGTVHPDAAPHPGWWQGPHGQVCSYYMLYLITKTYSSCACSCP
jgi:hypothetical protein